MTVSLNDISRERDEKLSSLFSNRISDETAKLRHELSKQNLSTADVAKIDAALAFAMKQDYGPRDLDRYYVTHPIRVARFVAQVESQNKTDLVIAALIHNAIEKDILSEQELRSNYGDWVADSIVALTVDRQAMNTKEGKDRYYRQLSASIREVRVLKIFDKLDNLFILCINPNAEIREQYLQEIESYILPMTEVALPEVASYLIELINDNRRIGFYKPTL